MDNVSAAETFCQSNRVDNLYFGVGLRADDTNGGKDNLSHIPAVFCDVDYKDIPREIFIDRFKSFPFKPSITVKSGGGVHLYWILKEPAEPSDIYAVENINRRIAMALGGDLNACDASRILRIPGTDNIKYVT